MSDKPQDYAIPVHRSLLKRDLILGVSKTAIVILLAATIIMVMGLGQFWFLAVAVGGLIALRFLTKKDEYLVEILLNTIQEPDDLYP